MELEGIPEADNRVTARRFGVAEIFWERWYPYLIGIVALLIEVATVAYVGMPQHTDSIADAISKGVDGMLSFASIMAGFAATLVGILFSIRETRKIKLLEKSGHFSTLKHYLYESVVVNLALSCFCILTGFVMPLAAFSFICWSTIAIVAVFVIAIFVVYRVINLMCKLL